MGQTIRGLRLRAPDGFTDRQIETVSIRSALAIIDVFRIGVHIGMTSNATQVLQTMLRQLTGIHVGTQQINAQFRTMALLGGGAIAAIAGTKALEGIWGVVRASQKLNDELTRTKQLGGDFAASIRDGSARAAAFNVTRDVPTMAPSEAVRLQRELGSQMQNPKEAAAVLPAAMRTAAVISHYTGEDQETIIKNLIKIVDLRAKMFSMGPDGKEHVDPAKLGPELEAAARGLILGGNYIKSNDLLQMAKQAGVPVKSMTAEAFYAAMVEMGISQGASRAGTATTSLFSQLVGGTMTANTATEMQRMGLLKQGEWHSDHGKVIVGKAATDRFSHALEDPIAFITGTLNDTMNQKGMSQQEKLAEIFKLFGRQTTQRLVAEALSAAPQFERARSMFGDIPAVNDQFKMLMNENLSMNIIAFHAAWDGLMESLGSAGIPLAISIMQSLTSGIHDLTALAEAHPDASRHILELAAVAGTLFAAGGSVAVFTAAVRAISPVFGGLTALSAVPGIATLGAALSAVATGLSAIGALWFLKNALTPSSTQSEADDRAPYGGKSLHERFPELVVPGQGGLLHRQSYVPPSSGARGGAGGIIPVHVTNGRDIAEGTFRHAASMASRPASGPTGFDGDMGLLQPGFSHA